MRLKFLSLVIILLTAGFAPFAQAAPAQETGKEPLVQTQLILHDKVAERGKELPVGLLMTIKERWHTYWENPGDSGTPTDFEWTLPAGFSAGSIQFPVPERIDIGPLTTYGYEGQVLLATTINVPEDYKGDTFDVKLSAEWLVCEEICIPEYADFTVQVPVANRAEKDPVAALYFEENEKSLPVAQNWPVTVSQDATHTNITIRNVPEAFSQNYLVNGEFFPLDWGVVENPGESHLSISGTTLTISKKSGTRAIADADPYRFVLTHKDETGATVGVSLSTADAPVAAAVQQVESTIQMTLFKALILAFMGGLVLNLMPCVFPILSMKALHLVRTAQGHRKEAVLHGVAYTAGVLVSFLLVAGALIALRSAGASIGWGFHLQNPLVLLTLVWLVFLLGMNLYGVFEFGARFANVGSRLGQNNGLSGAFFTGFLATVVATPCTAPFMGAAIGFAIIQHWYVALLIFATLGFGLAFPFLLLSISPGLQRLMPKPGAWMDSFRRFLAFPMFATGIWLVWVIMQQSGANVAAAALLGCLGFSFVLWLWTLPVGRYYFARAVGIFMLFLIIVLIPVSISGGSSPASKTGSAVQNEQHGEWTPYSSDALKEALASSDPVFVNMTAAWCITCKVNERVALDIQDTKEIFAGQNTRLLKGDWTNYDADITSYLATFDRNGVPIYVYYGKPDSNGKRPDPVVLPQILTPGIVKEAING